MQQRRWVIYIAGAITLLVFIPWVLLGPLAWLIAGDTVRVLEDKKERADAINDVRERILTTGLALGAVAAGLWGGLTYRLSRREQVTDRFARAVSQLASDKIDERIGGIYALEHVMSESAQDHESIVQVLSAFIRGHARPPVDPADASRQRPATQQEEPTTDVQAALTVLSRREERTETKPIDLRGAWLPGADLQGARLWGARLDAANLQGAHLERAQLQGAGMLGTKLREAHLEHANMRDAKLGDLRVRHAAELQDAWLFHADLRDAELSWSDLRGAWLGGANLQDAVLIRADLRGALLAPGKKTLGPGTEDYHDEGVCKVTAEDLAGAVIDDTTVLPAGMRENIQSSEE